MIYLVKKRPLGGADVLCELLLEFCDLGGVHLVQESSDTAVDDCDLLLNGHGHILSLKDRTKHEGYYLWRWGRG